MWHGSAFQASQNTYYGKQVTNVKVLMVRYSEKAMEFLLHLFIFFHTSYRFLCFAKKLSLFSPRPWYLVLNSHSLLELNYYN